MLVNDYARCRGEENLTRSKINLSPELGLFFQRSQDVSAFLGACVCVCVCWGKGARHTEAAQEQVLKWSLTQPSLNRAGYKGSKKNWRERFQCYLFGTSSTISAPSVV